MAEVSVGRALGAGFSLIRRHPGAIAAWAVVYIVLGVLPQLAIWSLLGPNLLKIMQTAASSGTPAMSAEMLQAQAQLNALQPLIWATSIVTQALLLGAAYRAVLFPEDRGFFFLRLGRRELWLGLVILVIYVGLFVVIVAATIPAAIVVAILSLAGGGRGVGAMIGFSIGMVFVFSIIIWVGLRFSLAPAMSFAERGFRLFESWTATRGAALPMFLVALSIMLIALAVELALGGVVFVALGGFSGLASLGATLRQGGFNLASVAPFAAGGGVLLALLGAVFYALFGGAWAQIYRDLNPKPEEVF